MKIETPMWMFACGLALVVTVSGCSGQSSQMPGASVQQEAASEAQAEAPVGQADVVAPISDTTASNGSEFAAGPLPTAGNSGGIASWRIAIYRDAPIFCMSLASFLDCSDGATLGELHNQLLRAAFGDKVPISTPPTRAAQMPTVKAGVERSSRWIGTSPLFDGRRSTKDITLLTDQITKRFQAAGLVGQDGRFSRAALEDPSRAIASVEKSGVISPVLGATLRRLSAGKASADEYRRTVQGVRWQGQDRLAAAIVTNFVISSNQYFGPPTLSQVGPGPGFWDALGTLLTIELGPGAVVGGYLMSAASCGCFSF